MTKPVLDSRDREAIMAQLAARARAYTPQWRYERAEDDPGAALAELFGEMHYQTVDRFNSVPEKLHTEFLNLTGFRMPDPVSASGLIQFTAHDTVEEPVPVPQGTQLFTEDEEGEHVVYATRRRIEATPARLQALYYVDARAEIIQRLDPGKPQPFFCPVEGENLQRHCFTLGQDDVLSLAGPFEVEVELRQEGGFTAAETIARLADPSLVQWTFPTRDGREPFTAVRAEGNALLLTYQGQAAFAADEEGHYSITCTGTLGSDRLVLDGASLRSRPLDWVELDGAANGDIPLDLSEGGYCFGRRPGAYSLCYFRSDQVFRKRGGRAHLRLEIVPVITDLNGEEPHYQFNQRIIDKRDAVAVVPDDVYVAQVAWEYFNGLGWRPLAVSGNRNPFSCKQAGPLELTFDIPADLTEAEVNAQPGYYIRARVIHVENEFSMNQRWVVPLMKGARCTWAYDRGLPAEWLSAENNGGAARLEYTDGIARLAFPALTGLEDHPKAMYLCFDRSPHAMPLSIHLDMAGRVYLEDKVRFEAWIGSRFQPVRTVDLTRNLLQSGVMLLYLPKALPAYTLFGTEGYWLRLSRSSYLDNPGGWPRVNAVGLNMVEALQQEEAEESFSVSAYEAGKEVSLLHMPVLETQVWVDEVGALGVSEAEALVRAMPDRVELERKDRVITHCWVLWRRQDQLALAGPEERCYSLDPYQGTLTFGDGIHGQVPPQGEENLRVRYRFGGGSRGNRPAGAVQQSVGSLPRISHMENLTPMSGGTDRLSPEKVDAVGSKALRHRHRAAGVRDFEEIVYQDFPQARHVKCFSGRDAAGAYAPGHVSVVVEGCDLDSRRVTDDLCQRIYESLSQQCDCVLAAEGRLHVVGSTVITVSSTVAVEMEDLDQAAATQQAIARRLEDLINRRWRERDIGDQIRIAQVWQTVRDTPNVRLVKSILLEGWYDQAGVERVAPLEEDGAFPYATVKSGTHLVQVE